MSNALSPFAKSTALTLDSIVAGLDNSLMNAPTVENKQGVQYLRMKDGSWTIGKEGHSVSEGDEFVVHPAMFTHGYVAWHGGRPEFKEMIPSSQPVTTIQTPDPRSLKAKHGLEFARGMTLAGCEGDHVGVTAQYDANSMGGKEAIEAIMRAVKERVGEGADDICPIVVLKSDGYTHKEHGWIDKPIFEIVSWMTLAEATELAEEIEEEDVDPTPEPEPEVEEAEVVQETGRRRRRAK